MDIQMFSFYLMTQQRNIMKKTLSIFHTKKRYTDINILIIKIFSRNHNVQDLKLAIKQINQDVYILENEITSFI